MGNCQTAEAEAATLAVQHPDGRLDRYYWSMRSHDVMAANPGHYVASIITYNTTTFADSPSPPKRAATATGAAAGLPKGRPVRYVKLLGPEETLLVGHFYRLVSFEEVLRVFGSKKRVRLSKLLAREEGRRRDAVADALGVDRASPPSSLMEEQEEQQRWGIGNFEGRRSSAIGIKMSKHAQWRPTLQSIAEIGV